MTFKISPRESVSRSDAFYDNKFRIYAEEPRLKEARIARSKDTLESGPSLRERELADKFRRGIFSFDLGVVKFTKQIGRFVFVSIAKPLELLAIRLPAMIVQFALPFLINLSGNFQNKFTDAASVLQTWLINVSGVLQEAFNRYFLKKMEYFENLLKSTKDFIKKQFQKRVAPLKRLLERLKEKRENIKLPKLPRFKLPRFKLPKLTLRLPRFKLPQLPKLPKFKLPQMPSFPRLRRAGRIAYAIAKGLSLFFAEIAVANYEIWIAPWLLRLYRFLKARLLQAKKRLHEKLLALKFEIKLPPLPRFKLPKLPSLPKFKLPTLPKLPSLLKFKLPKLPKFPAIQLPKLSIPIKAKQWVSEGTLHVKVFFKVLFEQLS